MRSSGTSHALSAVVYCSLSLSEHVPSKAWFQGYLTCYENGVVAVWTMTAGNQSNCSDCSTLATLSLPWDRGMVWCRLFSRGYRPLKLDYWCGQGVSLLTSIDVRPWYHSDTCLLTLNPCDHRWFGWTVACGLACAG